MKKTSLFVWIGRKAKAGPFLMTIDKRPAGNFDYSVEFLEAQGGGVLLQAGSMKSEAAARLHAETAVYQWMRLVHESLCTPLN